MTSCLKLPRRLRVFLNLHWFQSCGNLLYPQVSPSDCMGGFRYSNSYTVDDLVSLPAFSQILSLSGTSWSHKVAKICWILCKFFVYSDPCHFFRSTAYKKRQVRSRRTKASTRRAGTRPSMTSQEAK